MAPCLLALGLLVPGPGCSEAPSSPSDRPDLILISLDTLRQDRCSLYGYERETTPFLEELGAESLVYENARSVSTWTLISHMSLLTGLYPSQHGVFEATAALAESVPMLTQLLAASDARTAGVYFPGWLDGRFGFDRGFNVGYESALDAEEAKKVLDGFLPWGPNDWAFTFIHLLDIHSDDTRRSGSLIYDNPPPYDTFFDPKAKETLAGIDAFRAWEEDASDFSPEMIAAVGALYDGGIRYVDDTLRAWFAEWEEQGLLDNAIVIITSDHGEGLRLRTKRFGGHGDLFEEGLRVPLVVHFSPKARTWAAERLEIDEADLVGRRTENVSHVDLVPTILQLYDVPSTIGYPGTPILTPTDPKRIIHAQRPPDHFVSYEGDLKVHCVRDGRVVAFADLSDDPNGLRQGRPEGSEQAELAKELGLRATQDRRSLEEYLPGGADELDEAAKEQLRGLGYVNELKD